MNLKLELSQKHIKLLTHLSLSLLSTYAACTPQSLQFALPVCERFVLEVTATETAARLP